MLIYWKIASPPLLVEAHKIVTSFVDSVLTCSRRNPYQFGTLRRIKKQLESKGDLGHSLALLSGNEAGGRHKSKQCLFYSYRASDAFLKLSREIQSNISLLTTSH